MAVLTFLILVLLLHGNLTLSRPHCYSCDQTSCGCSRQNFTTVPVTSSKLISELDLSFNRLTIVTDKDLDVYASLVTLLLNNNSITTIHENAFITLTILEKLDLSYNQLETLSAGWFQNLLSLQHLSLLGNKYTTLGQGNLFQPLKRLKRLYFGGPSFLHLRKADFSGLSHLEEVTFVGRKLQDYEEGSFKQIWPIESITLNLNGPFKRNHAVVRAILSDVVSANTTLTFIDTRFFTTHQMSPFDVVSKGGTRSLMFKNIITTAVAMLTMINQFSGSNLTKLTLEDIKLFFDLALFFQVQEIDSLKEVILKNIDIPRYYSFVLLNFLKPLLEVVTKVSVVNANVYVLPCITSELFSHLEYIDISENYITDRALSEMFCDGNDGNDGNDVLKTLRVLNVSRNYLLVINSRIFSRLDKLEIIDMSGSLFDRMPEICYWPQSLQFLNLSSSHLTTVTACLPMTLRVLDLTDNLLTVFNVKLPYLKELYISGNKLRTLPDGGLFPRLGVLSIQNNDLQTFSRNVLQTYNNLTSLQARTNTYVCSCDFVAFMRNDVTNQKVVIEDDLRGYVCDSPDAERGRSVGDVRLSVFECHTAVAFSVLCLFIFAVILLIVCLCHKFNVLWYLKMTWTWLRAKKKPKLKRGELEFDAFVSYSEMDSGWVDAHLVPELEQAEPRLRLCLHKRDFIPGGWIPDNIMDAIEKSHRTLFVLSKNFVRSEWCKYELDYTHFRLFDHNDDTVVLILLEPIDKDSIPKTFCKLRKVMNSRTYLEWPDDDNQIPRFWQNLRAAVMRPEAGNVDFLIAE